MAVLVAVVVMAAPATDLHARQRTQHEQAVLAAARRAVWEKQSSVSRTVNVTKRASGIRNSLQETAGTLQGQLATDQTALATTNNEAETQGAAIGTLQTCLEGVNGALQQITAHNKTQATADISSASGACLTLEGGADSGLVYPFDFPDPFVLRVGNLYVAYATNSTEGNIQIIDSTDLVHWSAVGNALPNLPAWAEPGGTWAPSVLQVGGTFVLYYVAMVAGARDEECISVATATSPEGPFVDNSVAPLVCQSCLNGSIDPSPFVDATGTPYLEWKSNGGAGHPATIWSAQLDCVRHRLRHQLADRAAGRRPSVGSRGDRGAGPRLLRRAVLPLLLGEQLEQRQLRHRCRNLPGSRRPVHRSDIAADPVVRARHGRPRR